MPIWKTVHALLDEGGRTHQEVADEVRRLHPSASTTARSVASMAVAYRRKRGLASQSGSSERRVRPPAPLHPRSVQLSEIGPLIDRARGVALAYKALTGRPLGITGEVGEYEAARLLDLELAPPRAPGFDARDGNGRRFQIKTRCIEIEGRSQQIGSLKTAYEWEAALLVLLDSQLRPTEIWEAERSEVIAALDAPGSTARNVRRAMAVSQFKAIGRRVWCSAGGV